MALVTILLLGLLVGATGKLLKARAENHKAKIHAWERKQRDAQRRQRYENR